ncbi:MAG: DNA polymerase II [uncultured Thermomicrobiales bacterium]|uniref:DNA-directed DNA polymerase n=1 Tax=uncultured Thermomicrobiales bacterium TaxID=1645740 RepID=A0A6J4UVB9_9BACT|nr:MAG: DNA polymerase II [uncultured Thermomicrobiales bacterium]
MHDQNPDRPITSMNSPTFDAAHANRVLYGKDTTEGIVSIEVDGPHHARIFCRDRDSGQTTSHLEPMSRWIVTTADHPVLRQIRGSEHTLTGDLPLSVFVTFDSRQEYMRAASALPRRDPDSIKLRSPLSQFLIASGKTFFKGMAFEDLRRMQLDIETLGFDPKEPDAHVIMVAMRQGDWEEVLVLKTDEADLLQRVVDCIQTRDPDVIEGHNIFNFDLPYLVERARRANVRFSMGRDGSEPNVADFTQRFRAGGISLPFSTVHIYGRHVIDTYQQVQRWDTTGRLPSYGLKNIIRALDIEREGREFVEGEQIAVLWNRGERSKDRLARYALDDVRDVDLLSRITLPTEFYQTQILPMAFQTASTAGTGTKIDQLMMRAYLTERHSLPKPEEARPYPGGYVELVETGIFGPVVKCDVESLYPSIMLERGILPRTDVMGAFPLLLEDLTRRRIESKRKAATTRGEAYALHDGLQATFKILINSFYGYLGFQRGHFNDYDAAEAVTIEGQRIIKEVVNNLQERGSKVIEVDTDGVFFTPPEEIATQEEEEALIREVSRDMPLRIRLAHDGRYRRMLSLKQKTYALLDFEDKLILKGSALRSRRMEPCLQRFLQDATRHFLEDDKDAARDRYFSLAEAIQQRKLEPRDFSQWQMLREGTIEAHPRLGTLLAGNPGRWRFGDRVEIYERQDGALGFAEDYDRDENVQVLLRHLRDTAMRFEPIFDSRSEFDAFFPPIQPRTDLAIAREAKPVEQLSLL